jgi:hypothetical protein
MFFKTIFFFSAYSYMFEDDQEVVYTLVMEGVATPLWDKCEDETHTPKVGSWSPPGLPKTQSSSSRVKTLRIEVFFISMKRS